MNNTVKRTLFGILFLAIMVGGLVLNKYLYGVLLLAMVIGMI